MSSHHPSPCSYNNMHSLWRLYARLWCVSMGICEDRHLHWTRKCSKFKDVSLGWGQGSAQAMPKLFNPLPYGSRFVHKATEMLKQGPSSNCCDNVGNDLNNCLKCIFFAVPLIICFTGIMWHKLSKTVPDYYFSSSKLYSWYYPLGLVAFSRHSSNLHSSITI